MRPLQPLLLLTLLYASLTRGETLHFPRSASSCTGGAADDAHLHPGVVTCTRQRAAAKWRCASTAARDCFLRIHHARVTCAREGCTLEYRLDFTPLAVFVIGLLGTVLAGVLLAVAMYLAVVRMAGRYERAEQRVRVVGRREGYGSFGGKLYRLGSFTDSLKSLLEFEEGEEDVERGEGEGMKEKEEKERAELVEREIYLG